MTAGDQARVSMAVAADPARAFVAFTEEINLWWRRGPRFRNAPGDQGLICLEPHLGGRVFESYAVGGQETVVEIGRIKRWEPPHHLLFDWRNATFAPGEMTEVEITFKARGAGTLVTVVHRGWSSVRPDHPARHGQAEQAFLRMIGMWWADMLRSLDGRVRRLRG